MIKKEFTILNKYGLHARPAAQLVKVTGKFKSSIKIEKDGITADGKSIMGLMTLAAEVGSTIIVIADGEDAQQAVDAVSELINNKFYED